MMTDLLNGLFKRIFILDESALLGTPSADEDMRQIYRTAGGF
jgi:hypothetical protein